MEQDSIPGISNAALFMVLIDLRIQDLDVEANYRVDSVLCLVDAKNIRKQLQRIPTEGAVRQERAAGDLFVEMIFLIACRKYCRSAPNDLLFPQDGDSVLWLIVFAGFGGA